MKSRIVLFFLFSSLFMKAEGLYAQASGKSCPCCQEVYRQFDFWVGTWETEANGKVVGTNEIYLLQDSCVIQENWTATGGGYTGTSYNFYDPQDEMWHQTWIDNQGQSLRLSGKLEGSAMVLGSEPMKNRKGEWVIHRITWTPNSDSSVRQHWETRPKDGDTWQTLFDGLYRRK